MGYFGRRESGASVEDVPLADEEGAAGSALGGLDDGERFARGGVEGVALERMRAEAPVPLRPVRSHTLRRTRGRVAGLVRWCYGAPLRKSGLIDRECVPCLD